MKQTHLLAAAVLPLTFALLSFNAAAVSPPPPTGLNAPMISVSSFNSVNYVEQEVTKMFPAPKQGMVQHILTLPTLENEDDYLVEIQIGQTQLVDCNKHGLSGELKELTVKGWGYNYYQVDEVSQGPSTMMACFEMAKKEAFVRIPGELKMRYDSRLPKVFYLPAGTELRFRTWKVDSTYQYAK
ncbi:serine protease inhibitor ecotin [Shewanella sp. CG12_big_fil_rev_8_21_14_0_65_47_15]|uniref:serine protease inhibitor ecotin n=1 Tax=Shewanella sp. CG12_big_fil_rev_8_21_14_0_65_47_15 TaxID=1975537 RepID=UPI000CC7B608|nr:serine protease inhibitor ecotin [Shewanella sp. CG12_big_fil_rev_8_21_14_0_65_47_15]PIW62767.1 MAG: ecotin [Shewanella sp. CG12_big_fil_rev_8_21_14_0_65_47_15]